MSSAPNLEGILLLEQPFCKVTHDELKRQLRFQQRLIEREFNGCNSILKSLQDKHKVKSSREADNQDGSSQTRRKLNHQIGNEEENGNADSSMNVEVDDSIDAEMSVSIDQSFDGSNRQLALNGSSTSGNGGNQSNAQLEKSLDGMIGKLRGLKRKLSPLPNSLTSTLSSSKARYSHLQDLHEIKSTNSKEFENWSKIRLDRFISDWMLRRGFKESAKSIGREGWSNHPLGSIENLIDWDLFNELNGIEDSLVPPNGNGNGKNSCTLALNWCSENKSSLKKIKDSTIEFDLRLQEFIELNRVRTPESLKEAILYARKHLLPLLSQSPSSTISKPEASKEETLPNIPTSLSRSSGDTSIGIRAINRDLSRNQVTSSTSTPKNESTNATSSLTKEQEAEQLQQARMKSQILRAMGLLASGPNNWSYQDLYNQDKWLLLKENFRKVFLDLHSLPMSSTLHISLSAGLSSLKVPACYVPDPISTGSDEKLVDGKKKKDKVDGEGSEKGNHQPPNHLGRLGGGGSGDSNETWYAVRRSDGTVQISTNRNELLGDVNDDSPATGESNVVQVINSERSNVDEMNESNITSGSGTSTRINDDETGNISHGNPNSLPSSLTFNDNSSVLNVNQSLQIGTTSSTTHSHSHSVENGKGHGSTSDDFIKKKLNSSKSVDCPICDSKGLGLLAKEVPWSHHENSTLVCWISGKLINEENPPMCLPNGRAYSRSALEDMALKSKDGMTVVCPRTGDQYKFSELRKVYIS